MTLRYELAKKYIFQFSKTFNLNVKTIIKPQVTITFADLQFPQLEHKIITKFNILFITKKLDIIKFDNLTEDWSYTFIISEDTIIKIVIEFFWEIDKDKVHIMDWEEWILKKD
jgi:hypothetical protein